ncbi:C-C motif chemokine 19 isoform X2 [Mesoplodon densirostris]|uniref:C-C motif chemokine 19 isoform X2 n=1 Tax=Mesoplodon densirostris TaxID=48708 RepID=UPI0028DBFA65|nr:C-C motif chemokine 19 isoform X2 [Mesoplodon densirostris]
MGGSGSFLQLRPLSRSQTPSHPALPSTLTHSQPGLGFTQTLPRFAHAHSLLAVSLHSSSMASHAAALLALSLLMLWTSSVSLCPDTNPTPALGDANDAEDCCLSVTQRPFPGFLVRAYRYLLINNGCRVPAVVFTTLRGYQLCAPPDQPWVDRIIRRLQKNSAKGKRYSR